MQSNVLLLCLFGGLLLGGLRSPWLWAAAAGVLWATALLSRPWAGARRIKHWIPWLTWALASLLLSSQPWMGLYAFARWLTQILFFGLAAAAASTEWRRRWFWGLAAAAVTLAVASVFIRSPGGLMTGLIPPYYNYTMFVNAAFFCAAAAALGHPQGPRGKPRWFLAAGMALALTVIVLSRSRGALCAVAFSMVVWAAPRWRRRPRALLWTALAVLALAVLTPSDWLAHLLKFELSDWFKRPQIWRSALQAAADHPWFGEGVGNFAVGFSRHNFPKHWASNYGFIADHAHSELFEVLTETGWPGLLLFVGALIASVRIGGGDFTQEAASFALLAMGGQCLIDNMLQLPALGLLFFSALACSGGQAESEDAPWPRVWPWACLSGLLLVLSAPLPGFLLNRYWSHFHEWQDADERLERLSMIRDISPADEYLHESAARAWLESKPPNLPGALEEARLAQSLDPTNGYFPALEAEIRLRAGEPEKALGAVGRAVELEPNLLAARLLRAEILIGLKRQGEARGELGEIARRQNALVSMPVYSNYDRGMKNLDAARLERAKAAARLH